MEITQWVLFGLIVGIITNIVKPTPSSVLGTILLSITGAVLGGFLGSFIFGDLIESQLVSFLVVMGGALLLMVMQRAILRRSGT